MFLKSYLSGDKFFRGQFLNIYIYIYTLRSSTAWGSFAEKIKPSPISKQLFSKYISRLLEAEKYLAEADTIMKLEPPTSPYGHLSSTISRLFYCILVWRREGVIGGEESQPQKFPVRGTSKSSSFKYYYF